MINIKRIIHVQERDHSQYCQHHCALCKNPCEKQGRYPTLPGAHPPVAVTGPTLTARRTNDGDGCQG